MGSELVISDLSSAPELLHATFDRRYRYLTVHASRADAEREVAREPKMIDLVVFRQAMGPVKVRKT